MSLTTDDISAIRNVFNEGLEELVLPRFEGLENHLDGLEGRMGSLENRMQLQEQATHNLKAQIESESIATINHLRLMGGRIEDLASKVAGLEADVKELYTQSHTSRKQRGPVDKKFENLPLERKFLRLYEEFKAAAKEAGITLPQG